MGRGDSRLPGDPVLPDSGQRPETRSALRSHVLTFAIPALAPQHSLGSDRFAAACHFARDARRRKAARWRQALHFCAYTWLALLALLAIKHRSLAVMAALAIILLGVALEFGQKLVPGRGSFEVRDMFVIMEPRFLPVSQSAC